MPGTTERRQGGAVGLGEGLVVLQRLEWGGLSCEQLGGRAALGGRVLWRTGGRCRGPGPTGRREARVAGADLGGAGETEVREKQSLAGDGV